jgi:phospholipid/cholesterol/gamma-HCH transport system substrate-binding protein
MTARRQLSRLIGVALCAVLTVSGCAFQGLNSLPLPGTVGRGSGAQTYHVEFANVGTLESNSPVMVNDVIVGSVGKITVEGQHADVEVSVRPNTVVAANAVASIGQTSLLGSMHVALDPPLGEPPHGRMRPGAEIPLRKSSSYPSTEQTLSALSAVVNAGGLGQLGDIIHNFNAAVSGREPQIRALISRLNTFVGALNDQRDNIIATMQELSRFAGTLADQHVVLTRALQTIPPALEVVLRERPRISEALQSLGAFSATAAHVIDNVQADLVTNLNNLKPTICALADVGDDIDTALAYAPVFPLGQNLIDRGVRGDYINMFATFDITAARNKRGLAAGTHFFQGNDELVPAPGDPGYQSFYTRNPLGVGVTPTPPWLASLPASSPPLHQTGTVPWGVQAPILTLPPASTPSGCG